MDPLNEISIASTTTHAFKSQIRGNLGVRADMQACGWVGVCVLGGWVCGLCQLHHTGRTVLFLVFPLNSSAIS